MANSTTTYHAQLVEAGRGGERRSSVDRFGVFAVALSILLMVIALSSAPNNRAAPFEDLALASITNS